MMEPYPYIQRVAANLANIRTRAEADTVLDELEFLFDALEPELQDLCVAVMERVREHREHLP